jgi:hypothetical protein
MKSAHVILLFLLPMLGKAQCLDTLRFPTNPGNAFLGAGFFPVCGCDGNTYRNQCYAEWATLVQWTEGPCEQVAAYIFPNPVVYQLTAIVNTRYESDVQIYIFDRNGNMYFDSYIRSATYEYITIPTNDFDEGLYIFMAQSGSDVVLEKFIKWNE